MRKACWEAEVMARVQAPPVGGTNTNDKAMFQDGKSQLYSVYGNVTGKLHYRQTTQNMYRISSSQLD